MPFLFDMFAMALCMIAGISCSKANCIWEQISNILVKNENQMDTHIGGKFMSSHLMKMR